MSGVYYNDHDPFACAWLRELIKAGLLPEGEVDDRSILDVGASDLRPFRQCHFFAGIGGWPRALDLASFPPDREIWTASLPCQPLSVAGQGRGDADERHLWPAFHRLVAVRRPATIVGEQVASVDGREWLAGVRADLEAGGYACGGANLPACSVGAPHRRERLYWGAVADDGTRRELRTPDDRRWAPLDSWRAGLRPGNGAPLPSGTDARSESCGVAHPADGGREPVADAGPTDLQSEVAGAAQCGEQPRNRGASEVRGVADAEIVGGRAGLRQNESIFDGDGARGAGFWDGAEWRIGADGKARRVKPGVRLLAHGFPNRVGALRGFGNAIVPQVAAAFIRAVIDGTAQ